MPAMKPAERDMDALGDFNLPGLAATVGRQENFINGAAERGTSCPPAP